eukprot:960369_1
MKVNWNRVAARSTIIKHKGRIRIQSQQSHIASVNAIIQSNPHSPINDILHTYISHHHSSPNEVFLIWDDIIKTNEIQNANLSEALVIKTVAKTLKMCLSQTETKKCIQMLQYLLSNHTLQDDVNVYCLLIRAFSLHADIHGAEDTFYALPKHKINLRLITSLMNAYVHNQHYHKAIALYKQFPNVTHNDTSHTLCIKACQNTRNYEYAHQIITQHIHYLDGDHSEQLFNTLIHFYGTFNRIFLAEKVFAFIPIHKRNVIHVNTMMNAYVKNGLMDKCLQFYESNTVKDHVTHSSALKACIKCNHFSLGHQIIKQHIGYNNTQQHPIELLTSMIVFYGECHNIRAARDVFNHIPMTQLNVVCIGALMKAYIINDLSDEALAIYKHAKIQHNDITRLLALKSCMNVSDFEYGEKVIQSMSGAPKDIHLWSTMVDFYGKMEDIEKARNVFETLCGSGKQDTASMNVMMNAYVDNEMSRECMELFKHMMRNHHTTNIKPDHLSMSIVLKAAIHESALHFGESIHRYFIQHSATYHGILDYVIVEMHLIGLYGKCNRLDLCDDIFEQIKRTQSHKYESEIKIWNAMMNAYGRNGQIQRVLDLLDTMTRETQLKPDGKTYCILLNACKSHDYFDHIWHKYMMCDHAMDSTLDMEPLTRQQVLNRLHLLILSVRIKYDMAHADDIQNKDVLNTNFVSFPAYKVPYQSMEIELWRQMMRTVQNNNETQNKQWINDLICGLKSKIKDRKWNDKECLAILDGYGWMGNTDQMMTQYTQMLANGMRLTSQILNCVLHHLMRDGEAQYVADIWNEILKHKRIRLLNSSALRSLILCVNRSRNHHEPDILMNMWHFVVNEQNIAPDIHCHCLMTWSLSKHNQAMAQALLTQLENSDEMQRLLATNHVDFLQILNSYANMTQFDKMWAFYNEYIERWKHGKHDVDALKNMATLYTQLSEGLLHEIVRTLLRHFDLNCDLSVDELIVFHRIAAHTENKAMQDKISAVLQNKDKKIKMNVVSHFMLNGESHSICSGYDEGGCAFNSHQIVDALMQEIGYEMNTSECVYSQLSSDVAKRNHLKSHSEKKALAILLKQQNEQNIKIKVSMRMCVDCHDFFCQISKQYKTQNIQCVDPKGIHIFQNGVCQLCGYN